jgi:hypothetical protein
MRIDRHIKPNDAGIRREIIDRARQDLEALTPDTLVGWNPTGQIPTEQETIRFGDLPIEHQELIREALWQRTRGEFVGYSFE